MISSDFNKYCKNYTPTNENGSDYIHATKTVGPILITENVSVGIGVQKLKFIDSLLPFHSLKCMFSSKPVYIYKLYVVRWIIFKPVSTFEIGRVPTA